MSNGDMNTRLGKRHNDKALGILLIAPAFAFLFALLVVPQLIAMGMAFTNYNYGITPKFKGIRNFRIILMDPNFLNSVKVNVLYVLSTVSLEMILGVFLSVHMTKRIRLKGLWLALIMTPMALAETVLITGWRYLLDLNVGIVNFVIETFGFERINFLGSTTAFPILVLISAWAAIPQVFLFVYPACSTVPVSLYESAALDGAGDWQVLTRITLPLIKPAIFVALIFRTIFTIRAFGIPWLLAKGGPDRRTELMSIFMYKEGFSYNRLYSAAAVSWFILIITIALSSWLIARMYRNMFRKNTADSQ